LLYFVVYLRAREKAQIQNNLIKGVVMAEFYEVKASDRHKELADLDHVAVEKGGVTDAWLRTQYGCPVAESDVGGFGEYSSIRIATGGTGNGGTLVLRGLTPRARNLIRQGKIKTLTLEGIRPAVAAACACSGYGMESAVAQAADDLLELYLQVKPEGPMFSHAHFDKWAGELTPALTFPRKMAVLNILAKVRV
jgi:hypothetical protein